MDLWSGPRRELEGAAGARRGAHVENRLNSTSSCVLYLDNQNRPPPYRVWALPEPHPCVRSRVLRRPGLPSAFGRGCDAATAGLYRG